MPACERQYFYCYNNFHHHTSCISTLRHLPQPTSRRSTSTSTSTRTRITSTSRRSTSRSTWSTCHSRRAQGARCRCTQLPTDAAGEDEAQTDQGGTPSDRNVAPSLKLLVKLSNHPKLSNHNQPSIPLVAQRDIGRPKYKVTVPIWVRGSKTIPKYIENIQVLR